MEWYYVFGEVDWSRNASRGLSAIAEFLVLISCVPNVVIQCCGLMWDSDKSRVWITIRTA